MSSQDENTFKIINLETVTSHYKIPSRWLPLLNIKESEFKEFQHISKDEYSKQLAKIRNCVLPKLSLVQVESEHQETSVPLQISIPSFGLKTSQSLQRPLPSESNNIIHHCEKDVLNENAPKNNSDPSHIIKSSPENLSSGYEDLDLFDQLDFEPLSPTTDKQRQIHSDQLIIKSDSDNFIYSDILDVLESEPNVIGDESDVEDYHYLLSQDSHIPSYDDSKLYHEDLESEGDFNYSYSGGILEFIDPEDENDYDGEEEGRSLHEEADGFDPVSDSSSNVIDLISEQFQDVHVYTQTTRDDTMTSNFEETQLFSDDFMMQQPQRKKIRYADEYGNSKYKEILDSDLLPSDDEEQLEVCRSKDRDFAILPSSSGTQEVLRSSDGDREVIVNNSAGWFLDTEKP